MIHVDANGYEILWFELDKPVAISSFISVFCWFKLETFSSVNKTLTASSDQNQWIIFGLQI